VGVGGVVGAEGAFGCGGGSGGLGMGGVVEGLLFLLVVGGAVWRGFCCVEGVFVVGGLVVVSVFFFVLGVFDFSFGFFCFFLFFFCCPL